MSIILSDSIFTENIPSLEYSMDTRNLTLPPIASAAKASICGNSHLESPLRCDRCGVSTCMDCSIQVLNGAEWCRKCTATPLKHEDLKAAVYRASDKVVEEKEDKSSEHTTETVWSQNEEYNISDKDEFEHSDLESSEDFCDAWPPRKKIKSSKQK
eukprot:1343778-Amorphochlora_amoeboformis.AAC.1